MRINVRVVGAIHTVWLDMETDGGRELLLGLGFTAEVAKAAARETLALAGALVDAVDFAPLVAS